MLLVPLKSATWAVSKCCMCYYTIRNDPPDKYMMFDATDWHNVEISK